MKIEDFVPDKPIFARSEVKTLILEAVIAFQKECLWACKDYDLTVEVSPLFASGYHAGRLGCEKDISLLEINVASS